MFPGIAVQLCVVPVAGATAVEALEANIETGGVILDCQPGRGDTLTGSIRTMESKHWVQSSRYTESATVGLDRSNDMSALAKQKM